MDAIELLKKDHQEVTKLFQRFRGAKGDRAGAAVVEKICDELDVHSLIEEDIFYPAVRRADDDLAAKVDEALQEHARVKQQVATLRARVREAGREDAGDLSGQVGALEQDVEHHVTEEEGEMFPRVTEAMSERERSELGERLQRRKRELAGETAKPARGRASRRTGTRRATTGRRRRARTSARGKPKARRMRTNARRTSARGAKRTRGRTAKSGGRKRARGGRGR